MRYIKMQTSGALYVFFLFAPRSLITAEDDKNYKQVIRNSYGVPRSLNSLPDNKDPTTALSGLSVFENTASKIIFL